MAALRSDGPVAPAAIGGAKTGDLFRGLRRACARAGDVAVTDDLSSHTRAAAVRAIRRGGCSAVYPPPGSPDYDPTESAFAKIEARLRAAELRTADKAECLFGTVREGFTPDECSDYLRHAGYAAARQANAL